jgi:hypothetical protein
VVLVAQRRERRVGVDDLDGEPFGVQVFTGPRRQDLNEGTRDLRAQW